MDRRSDPRCVNARVLSLRDEVSKIVAPSGFIETRYLRTNPLRALGTLL